jgi:ADP-ribosylglycohydrolase
MRYSISSRFRGTILGMAIGEILGKASSADSLLTQALLGMETLIQAGRFDLEAWRQAVGNSDLGTLESIVATLPIALFYHENEIKLRQNLQLALAAVGQDRPESRDGTLAIGYAIAKSVQVKLHWTELISQTISFLEESQTLVLQKLILVKSLLEQNAGLEQAVTALGIPEEPSSQIALAFYCWLSTLEDFYLSIKRAVHKSAQQQFTSAITGALSGAYNGLAGIPATLRLLVVDSSSQSLVATGMTTETEMLRLSDALVAVWSGVYEQANPQTGLTQIAAIAAPRVMRAR